MGTKNIKHGDYLLEAFNLAVRIGCTCTIVKFKVCGIESRVLPYCEPEKGKATAKKVVEATEGEVWVKRKVLTELTKDGLDHLM